MYKTLDYWSRDILNFNFPEKGLGVVSPSHFVNDFSRQMFLMLYSINSQNFIVLLPLLLKILANMYITIVLRKIFQNREKDFRIKNNLSQSRKIFQDREICFRIEKYFVTKIEKKSLELNILAIFLKFYCMRTFSYCKVMFCTKCGTQIENEYHF